MKIIEYSNRTVPCDMPMTSVALGFFDGVHLGHRDIIRGTVACAKEKGLTPAVFTFPSESEGIKKNAPRLYSTEKKLEFLESLGIELAVVADFDFVKSLSPIDFISTVLCRDLNCRVAHLGYNFRFGKGALGSAELLKDALSKEGREAVVYSERRFLEKELSASAIRQILSLGDVKTAGEMLGERYSLRGKVEKGIGFGHKMGIPTVNIPTPLDFPLMKGVYATKAVIKNGEYIGITNIGVCPTVKLREVHSETYILDFDGELYDEEITLYFYDFLRPEATFPSKEALYAQIEKDKESAKQLLG